MAGVGLHTGKRVSLEIRPAAPDTGIVFTRGDLGFEHNSIAASWRHAAPAKLCTLLDNGAGVRVRTVEHLLAALFFRRIDNASVLLDAEELPIADGSAAPFVSLLAEAGAVEQESPRKSIRVLKPLEISEGRSLVRLEPAEAFEIDLTIGLNGIGRLNWSGEVVPETACIELAPARTFGRLRNAWPLFLAGKLRLAPYLRGASLANVLVLVGGKVINPGGLRTEDEFVRHRVVDAVGDMMLAGQPIIGRLTAVRGHHGLYHRIIAALFADDDAWSH